MGKYHQNYISSSSDALCFDSLATSKSVTIEKFYTEYLDYVNDPDTFSESYQRSIDLTIRHFKNYFGSEKDLSTITEREYEQFFRHLKITAPRGYRVYYRTLSAALSVATKWNYLTNNPLRGDYFRKKYKQDRKKPLFINKDDLKKILNEIFDPTLKRIVVFAYLTGCRVSEIINLRWRNIDFVNRRIQVGESEFRTKDRDERIIPFSDTVVKLLKEQKSINFSNVQDLVFINQEGRKFKADNISKRFKKAIKKADVNQHFHFHCLRKSFISNLSNAGVSIQVICQLSGHNSLESITPYLCYEDKHLRSAIEKLE